MQFGVWMFCRGLEYRSIGPDSLDSVRIKGNKLGKDRNQKAVQFPWRMVSFGESGQSDLGSDREDVRQCLEQCVIGLEGLGRTWQSLECGYRLHLETIQKAVHFPWGNGLLLGNCIGRLLGPIQLTHGRCSFGLTRSFNPRKAVFFTHTLYPFRQATCI
jgi:hypothetical protein